MTDRQQIQDSQQVEDSQQDSPDIVEDAGAKKDQTGPVDEAALPKSSHAQDRVQVYSLLDGPSEEAQRASKRIKVSDEEAPKARGRPEQPPKFPMWLMASTDLSWSKMNAHMSKEAEDCYQKGMDGFQYTYHERWINTIDGTTVSEAVPFFVDLREMVETNVKDKSFRHILRLTSKGARPVDKSLPYTIPG